MRCSTEMASSEVMSVLPPIPDRRIVVAVGAISVDFLVTVAAFPKLDDKIRSTSSKIQGGGNAGNASTCAARLGLTTRLITKVANDTQGRNLLTELESDGVDTSFIVVSEEGNSPFTYVIVDDQTNSRTCIHTPGHPIMAPQDLSESSLFSALDHALLVYLDGRLHQTALVVAQMAYGRKIPIIIDVERKRDGLDNLLDLAKYVVCTVKFLQAWTGAFSLPSALVYLLLRLPDVKFVIATLGERGCVMLERVDEVACEIDVTDIDVALKELEGRIDDRQHLPTCISSKYLEFKADEIGTLRGRLYRATAEKIPPSELIDTTGAGDAFMGGIMYSLCTGMLPEKMLPFACQVAAAGCRALGARTGLPLLSDPCLAPFLR